MVCEPGVWCPLVVEKYMNERFKSTEMLGKKIGNIIPTLIHNPTAFRVGKRTSTIPKASNGGAQAYYRGPPGHGRQGVGLSRQRVALLARPRRRRSPGETHNGPLCKYPPPQQIMASDLEKDHIHRRPVSLLSLPPRPEDIILKF